MGQERGQSGGLDQQREDETTGSEEQDVHGEAWRTGNSHLKQPNAFC